MGRKVVLIEASIFLRIRHVQMLMGGAINIRDVQFPMKSMRRLVETVISQRTERFNIAKIRV